MSGDKDINVPNNDCVSRQAVIDALCSDCQGRCIPCDRYPCREIEVVNGVPAEPERKKGKWMFSNEEYFTYCSVCGQHDWRGYVPTVEEAARWMPICPKCGADMGEGEVG